MIRKFLKNIFGKTAVNLDQRSIDSYRATLLLKCQEWCSMQPGKGVQPSQNEVDGFYNDAKSLSEEALIEYNQKRINHQIIDMFSRVRVEMGPPSNSGIDESKFEIDGDNDDDDYDNDDDEESAYGLGNRSATVITRKGSLKESVGFELERKESNITNAGMGVFVKCDSDHTIVAGTVVALFPGLVHLQEFTSQGDYVVKNLLPDDELMLMARYDGHIIDGRKAHECAPNPYALAHLVNHVPKGEMPNVLQCPYDFPSDPLGLYEFPKRLRKYIPNSYAKRPTTFGTIDRSAFMHGMVLIAARPLSRGDELVMDYRLNPKAVQLPSWYHHFEKEEAEKRWGQ